MKRLEGLRNGLGRIAAERYPSPMGLVLYLFAAVTLVLVIGWAVYVLPTPGPLGAGALAVGLIPAGTIMGAIFAGLVIIWALLHGMRMVWRFFARRR